MTTIHPAPPFDAELEPILNVVTESLPSTLTLEHLPTLRSSPFIPSLEQLLTGAIVHEERTISGPAGAPDLLISIFRRGDHTTAGPAFFFTHVGGMIFGDRLVGIAPVLDYVELFDAVVVTVEYRLAPEHPAPAAVEDAYAALVWTAAHADELGFHPDQLITIGGSAGGGLAAGITLLARDRGAPALAGQILMYPMLDEHNNSVSSTQIDGIGVWDHNSNDMGWTALLGSRRGTDQITPYDSPSRASDLAGLPPTYIEVGSAEVFRDEATAYASTIWASGGIAELHVWPGGFHLFELIGPDTALAQAARAARTGWIQRTIPAR